MSHGWTGCHRMPALFSVQHRRKFDMHERNAERNHDWLKMHKNIFAEHLSSAGYQEAVARTNSICAYADARHCFTTNRLSRSLHSMVVGRWSFYAYYVCMTGSWSGSRDNRRIQAVGWPECRATCMIRRTHCCAKEYLCQQVVLR